jgi:hypothetical protein
VTSFRRRLCSTTAWSFRSDPSLPLRRLLRDHRVLLGHCSDPRSRGSSDRCAVAVAVAPIAGDHRGGRAGASVLRELDDSDDVPVVAEWRARRDIADLTDSFGARSSIQPDGSAAIARGRKSADRCGPGLVASNMTAIPEARISGPVRSLGRPQARPTIKHGCCDDPDGHASTRVTRLIPRTHAPSRRSGEFVRSGDGPHPVYDS